MSKKKKKFNFNQSQNQAMIKKMEDELGIKFIDFQNGIILYKGIKWRPLMNHAEYHCAYFEGILILNIFNFVFVPTTWSSE